MEKAPLTTQAAGEALEATQGAPTDPRRDSRGEWSVLLPLEVTPDSLGESGCEPEIPVARRDEH